MDEQPTVLDVIRVGTSIYRYQLVKPGPFGSMSQVWQVNVQPNVLQGFCTNIDESMRQAYLHRGEPDSAAYDGATRRLASSGQGLYDTLFPATDLHIQSLRRELAELTTPLLISTGDPQVHWELINDRLEEGYIGLKQSVGRRLQTRGIPRGVPMREGEWRCLVVANPNSDEEEDDLPEAAEEARKFKLWLEQNKVGSVDYLEGLEATLGALLDRLPAQEYDVIYYAGHIVPDAQSGEYALRLNGGELLCSSSIRNLVKGSPIVFLNGCWGGCSRGLDDGPGSLVGLTDGFLEAGAQIVIGSVFPVSDDGARAFAEKFFELALGGEPVGTAMRSARAHVMETKSYGTAWAGFVLYGNPCLQIRPPTNGEDDIERLLHSVGLDKDDFDESCLDVVERAASFGKQVGLVGTAHLFAAMVGGEDPSLRTRLNQLGIPADRLRSACEDAFNQDAAESEPATTLELSPNARNIISQSKQIAGKAGHDRIGEPDLVVSFVETGGGGMGHALTKLGVELSALILPDPWNPEDFTPEAWEALCYSAACNEGPGSELHQLARALHWHAVLRERRPGKSARQDGRLRRDTTGLRNRPGGSCAGGKPDGDRRGADFPERHPHSAVGKGHRRGRSAKTDQRFGPARGVCPAGRRPDGKGSQRSRHPAGSAHERGHPRRRRAGFVEVQRTRQGHYQPRSHLRAGQVL